jgi:DNA polymerase I-like protein with 3'-5' exonuclease and polymerase domains
LFHCGDPAEYSLIGVDAKGLQLRILANYAYSEEFAETVLTGDPHKKNIEILGLANKAAAKKFIYTLIMGGGGGRLAADQLQFGTKLSAKEGTALKQKMIDSIPGFGELIDRLQTELSKTGRIRLCDGTPIIVPRNGLGLSNHMVIPYLLQGDESRIMKKAMIYLEEDIRRQKIEAWKVADIHDEWQYICRRREAERFMALALGVFPRVGEFFNYKVPIEGDVKEGKTWAETH